MSFNRLIEVGSPSFSEHFSDDRAAETARTVGQQETPGVTSAQVRRCTGGGWQRSLRVFETVFAASLSVDYSGNGSGGDVDGELSVVVVEVLGGEVVDVSECHDGLEEWVPADREVHGAV